MKKKRTIILILTLLFAINIAFMGCQRKDTKKTAVIKEENVRKELSPYTKKTDMLEKTNSPNASDYATLNKLLEEIKEKTDKK